MTNAASVLQDGYRELTWYRDHVAEMKKHYDGEFVAICNQAVVGHARTMAGLMRLLEKKNISLSRPLIQYVSSMKEIL
jgi:hypothetical protein